VADRIGVNKVTMGGAELQAPQTRYVQTALTFSPELIASLVEYYNAQGYFRSGDKMPFILPSSPYDPDTCGTLDDLVSYNERLRIRAKQSDVHPSLRKIDESAYNKLNDFYFVSRLLAGSADLAAADKLLNRQAGGGSGAASMDAHQLNVLRGGLVDGEDSSLRMRRGASQYLQAPVVDRAGGNAQRQRQGLRPAYSRQMSNVELDGNLDGGYSSISSSGGGGFGGISQGVASSLGDLSRENLSGADFSRRFDDLANHVRTVHELAISRALLFASVNKQNFKSMLDNQLPVPFEALGLKPLMRYDTYTIVKMADAGQAGYIIFGNPCFTVSNYGMEQRRHHQFTCTGGFVMVDHRNIFVQHNAHVVNRGGGASTKAYDPRLQASNPGAYFNPAARKYGSNAGESIIWTLQAYGFHRRAPRAIDITGRKNKLKARGVIKADQAVALDYDTPYRTACLWGLRGSNEDTIADVDKGDQAYNTECLRGQTFYYDRSTGGFTQSCKDQSFSHWGETGTYPGVQRARAGGPLEFKDPNQGRESVSVSY
jgi:hypothetical protein